MRSRSLLRGVAIAVPVLTAGLSLTPIAQATSAPSAPALTASQARTLSTGVTDKVIIVFKDQEARTPDSPGDAATRTALVASVQRAVLSELTSTHARNVRHFSLVDAIAATVSPGEATRLRANPAVAEVIKDLPIPVAATPFVKPATAAAGIKPLPNACAPKGKVQLDPEAIENIHAANQSGIGDAAQNLGYTGAGVKVAFIADGVDPNNPDFIRANGQHVFVDYEDFSGTGTDAPTAGGEAFLDSSSIAAQGRHVYNVADYGVGLSTPCLIRVRGVAPGASLVGLNVFGSAQLAYNSVFLAAVDYAVNHDHVNVVNESFGSNPFPDASSLDLTKLANDAAVKAGVTVAVSSGDAGPTDTIGSPATDPNVLSVGATTTFRAYAQTGIGGITYPNVRGWLDNNISGLSSSGFTQDGSAVDVVAPGDLNWALCTPDLAKYADCSDFAGRPATLELSGGTSEAAPLTSGVAALVIQAYAKTHHGQDPTPAEVKQIIVSTTESIGAPAQQQGAGMLDAYQAVLAAASYSGATKRTGHTVLDSATQFNAVGPAEATQHFAETLTNDGTTAVTLGLTSRTLTAYSAVSTRSLSLSGNGLTDVVKFNVAKGQARLDASLAVPGLVNMSLIAPNGDLAAYNLPQGQGNYGDAQVTYPAPGTWTALLSAEGATNTVTAQFEAATARWHSFGTLSTPSLTLAVGASKSFTLTVPTPATPGDVAGSIVARSSDRTPGFAAATSIPVTLRTLAPTPAPTTTFTGTLTGGNGRAVATGQTAYYQVEVPAGLKALNAQIATGSSANTFLAVLVDPSTKEAASTASNGLLQTTSTGASQLQPEAGAQLHVLDPNPGLWTLVVDFYGTVSGTAVAQPFTVELDDTPVPVSAPGLPDSTGTKLAAGSPVTVGVQVTNRGTAPEAYFTDARLATEKTIGLASQTSSTLALPNLNGLVPEYLVPSHTTSVTARASSTAPLYFDFTWTFGDPDLFSSIGRSATGTLSSAAVAPGDWAVTPFLVGPTGAKPAKSVEATTAMTATSAAFDPSVTSPTGDLWLGSVDPTNGFTPYVVNPGETVTIPVTITPHGTSGTTVTGTVYVDDSSLISGAVTFDQLAGLVSEGSDVGALTYTYTIK